MQSICLENKGFNSEIKQEVQNWEHGTQKHMVRKLKALNELAYNDNISELPYELPYLITFLNYLSEWPCKTYLLLLQIYKEIF